MVGWCWRSPDACTRRLVELSGDEGAVESERKHQLQKRTLATELDVDVCGIRLGMVIVPLVL